MFKALGHTVIHYGHQDSKLECDEHVTVLSRDDYNKTYGDHDYKSKFFKFDMNDDAHKIFYKNAIAEISKRKQPGDFLLAFWGFGHYPICVEHKDMIVVEPGIGYAEGQFAPFRIYESYAIMHGVMGSDPIKNAGKCQAYHVVIPNYFDLDEFTYSEEKDDYFLHLGRIYFGKGIDITYRVCQELGLKLKVAGQGSLKEAGLKPLPGQIEEVGHADVVKRNQLMSRAKGFFLPSMFHEPFGGTKSESMLSGTPVITADWGVFNEDVIHGKTGFRCRTLDQFCYAADRINNMSDSKRALVAKNCNQWATRNYSLERVGLMYEEYFSMIYDVWKGKGIYELHPERKQLDWLKKYYPDGINDPESDI